MTFTYRLARRLARLRTVAWILGLTIIFACQQGGELKEGFGPPDPPSPTVTEVRLSPTTVSLVPGGTQQFTSTALAADGSVVTVVVTYLAEGGTVTPQGRYTAGTAPGTYRLIATEPGGVADTASLTVTSSQPVPLVAVDLSPATVTLAAGAVQQFLTTGRRSDGSNTTVSVDYTAAGGTITQAGQYTAGQTAGTFEVVATEPTTGLADTAAVTITVAPPTDQPPTVEANGPYSGTVGIPIQFSDAGSFDPEGSWTSVWDFGDGATSSSRNPSHSYTSGGSYTVTLTVTDQANQSASDVAAVTVVALPVDQPPTAVANGPYSGTVGTPVQFSSAGSFDPEGGPWTAAWDFGGGATSTAPNPSFIYTSPGSYTVILTVADQAGQTASDAASVTISGGSPPPPPSQAHPNEPAGNTPFAIWSTANLPANGVGNNNGAAELGCVWQLYDGLTQVNDPTTPPANKNVAVFTFPAGMSAGVGVGFFNIWDQCGETSNVDYEETYESFWFKQVGVNGVVEGNHGGGAKTFGHWGYGVNGRNTPVAEYMNTSEGFDTSFSIDFIVQYSPAGEAQPIPSHRVYQNVNAGYRIQVDHWYQMELVRVMNPDPNVANGILKIWLRRHDESTPTLVMDYSNKLYRWSANYNGSGSTASLSGFYGRHFNPIWGGGGPSKTQTDWLYLNDFYFSGKP